MCVSKDRDDDISYKKRKGLQRHLEVQNSGTGKTEIVGHVKKERAEMKSWEPRGTPIFSACQLSMLEWHCFTLVTDNSPRKQH